MAELQGRRRPDLVFENLHDDIQPGDYWKVIEEDGSPMVSNEPSNLTHMVWMLACPMPGTDTGFALGHLMRHTVREEEDGTISVRPGDGSSNSILMSRGANGPQWHGYIEHGVWRPA